MFNRIRGIYPAIILLVLLTACAASGESYDCDWVTYTEDDGLVNNWIASIAFEESGAVWAGTWGGGLSRFDGVENWFNTTSGDNLRSNYVDALVVDHEGALWMGTTSGLGRYDPNSQQWDHLGRDFFGSNVIVGSDPGPQAIAVGADGSLYFAYWLGDLRIFDGEEWHLQQPGGLLMSVDVAANNSIWVGVHNRGVMHIDQGGSTLYTKDDGLPGVVVFDVGVAPDQTVWAATDGGAAHFDGDRWRAYTDELVYPVASSVTFTPDGAVWFGSRGGVSRFDGKRWTLWPMEDANRDDWNTPIETAPDGSVWFGTWKGLMHCE
jgi:ligand-binding sensor domain-containing protein